MIISQIFDKLAGLLKSVFPDDDTSRDTIRFLITFLRHIQSKKIKHTNMNNGENGNRGPRRLLVENEMWSAVLVVQDLTALVLETSSGHRFIFSSMPMFQICSTHM